MQTNHSNIGTSTCNQNYADIVNSAFPPAKAALILQREQQNNRAKASPVQRTKAPASLAPTNIIIYQETPDNKLTLGKIAIAAMLAWMGV